MPVIHIVRVAELAQRYRFSTRPLAVHRVGEGHIYTRTAYNRWLAGGIVLALLTILVGGVRTDWGVRLLRFTGGKSNRKPPEQMV